MITLGTRRNDARMLFLVVDGDRFKVFRLEYLTTRKAVYVIDPVDSIEGLGFCVITTG